MTVPDSTHDDQRGAARRGSRAVLWLVPVGVLVAVAALLFVRSSRKEPLNVLLITVDTTRADRLGCYGRTTAQTPNMDQLAREGALFARCTASLPLTLPSHSSIMTGLYPVVHGARRNGTGRLADANVTLAETLREAGYSTQATVATYVLNRIFGIDQGFDVYHDLGGPNQVEQGKSERKGDEVCDDALEMLRSLAPARFFLWVHFYDPHHPYESERISDDTSPEAYEDEIAFMDVQIGRLLDELRRLKLDRNTLVVLVADHGEDLGQHGEYTHGFFLYETAMHVPLIIRCPGRIPGETTVAAQVRTIDVAPTVLDLLGQPAWEHAQGVSLLPLMTGRAEDLNLEACGEALEAHDAFALARLRSLSLGRMKYILAPRPELYDLDADRDELCNLVDDQADVAASMRERLRTIIAELPPPVVGPEATPVLSTDDVSRLESLGYVGSVVDDADEPLTELDRFEPRGGDPKDYTALFQTWHRVVLDQSRGNFAGVEVLLRNVLEDVPDVPRVRADLADALREQGKIDEALSVCEEAAELAPDNTHVLRAHGRALLAAGRWDEAIAKFSAVLNKTPDDFIALSGTGTALASLGQLNSARECFLVALKIQPDNASLLHALGVLSMRQGHLTDAEKYFQRALECDPDHAPSRRDLRRVKRSLRP